MGKNTDKIISENLIGKCSQKLLNHAEQSATDSLTSTLKRTTKKQQKWLTTSKEQISR